MGNGRNGRQKRENQDLARRRAEVILKVRSGLMTATAAAKELGVSRKTYYQWENRALEAMMDALENRPTGRPPTPPDPEAERLKKQVGQLEQQLEITETTMQIRKLLQQIQTDGTTEPDNRPACPSGTRAGRKKTKNKKGKKRSRPKR